MTDVTNDYLKRNAPLSPEEYAKQLEAADNGAYDDGPAPLAGVDIVADEIAVTAPRLPDDGTLDDNGNPIEQPEGVVGWGKEIGGAVATGVVTAGSEIIHTAANITDFLVPFQEDPEYFTKLADEYAPRMSDEDYASVGLKAPVSTVGKLTRTTAQFMTGFVPSLSAMRVIGGINSATKVAGAAKTLAGAGAAGAITDLSVFNPYEERLTNFAKDSGIPGLDNAVTQYLAADENDPELLGRVKQALEGFVVGKVADAFVSTIGLYKRSKNVVLEERGVRTPKETKIAYVTDPATGSRVEIDTTNPEHMVAVQRNGIDVKGYSLPEAKAFVRMPDEQTQQDLATSILDGDIEGAAFKQSGLVNLKYLDTDGDIRDLIESLAVTRDAAVGKYRRGWEEAAAKQGKDLSTYAARVSGLDSDVVKAEYARTVVAYKVRELANIAKANPSAMALEEFKDAFKKLNVVDTMVTQNKAEIARAMAIMRRKSNIGDFIDNVKTAAKGAVGGSGETQWETLAKAIGDMPDSTGISLAVKASRMPNWKDALTEVYVNNLFSPITLTKNLVATSLSIGNSIGERYLGAAVSQIKGSGELTLREANQYALGMVKAIPEAIRVGWKSYKTDTPQLSQTVNEFVEEMKPQAFRGESFGITVDSHPLIQHLGKGLDLMGTALRSLPGGTRSLMATDELMKTIVYRAELGALAQREAVKAGLKPGTPEFAQKILEIDQAVAKNDPKNPFYGLQMSAMDAAHRGTFTEKLGEGGQNLLSAIRHFKLSYIPFPFIKTPVNLMKYMYRRTPGLAGFSDYVEQEMKAGGARADLVSAQLGLGSMYIAAGMALAGTGALQGDVTNNWGVNRNLRALGIQQRSFVDAEGNQLQVGGFDGSPLSMMLLAATTQETIDAYIEHNKDRMTDEELGDGVMQIMMIPIAASMKYTLNATWAQGMSSILNAAQEDSFDTYAKGLIGNTLPAGNTIKYANQQFEVDPFAREVDEALDAIRAKIPKFSRDLAPKATLLGDPAEVNEFMAYGLIPSYVTVPPEHPVYQELNRLQRGKPNEVILGGVPKVIGDVELDGTEKWNMMQFMRFLKVDGMDLIDQLGEVMASPDYAEATDIMKENLLSQVYIKRKELAQRALERDAAAFYEGQPRPYAERMRLYDYRRRNSITDKIANEKALKVRDKFGIFGENGETREDFVKQYRDAVIDNNFIEELTQ